MIPRRFGAGWMGCRLKPYFQRKSYFLLSLNDASHKKKKNIVDVLLKND